jgi:hypothetical protein
MINRADELWWLVKFLYKEYTEELFINSGDKYVKLCREVILHDADERLGRTLNEIEIGFVKEEVKTLIKFDKNKVKA